MPILQEHLYIKKSGIPGAGKGLFTRRFIPKGTRIIEYKGEITTWRKVLQTERETKVINKYLYYLNRNHVIDAMGEPGKPARYINDARGLTIYKDLVNNCKFLEEKTKVFIVAKIDIAAGDELLISYGKAYWDMVRKIMHPATIF